ncbi:T9SS type A sorting domain-containing protein [Fluviicola sp.]|jgi:hypothetical protein|uniref:T9SS type A sorting domain-containing protein n=1 Tax=Fluviicola sp. TaxID=1917219 RepID=UPI00282B6476|nr:T9SS type A sorting domain-containing protein [Fluviicola sp.]MDR0802113.1 T9SS type A sorting domain-containing protein [Fluviicola sp.]
MKKIYSLVIVALVTWSAGFGQTEIKLWDAGSQSGIGNMLNGTDYTYAVSSDGTHGVTINFKNVSATNKTWKMERYRITDVASWTDYLCWGAPGDPFGQCYTAPIMSTNPWTSPAQYSLDIAPGESANLIADTDTDGSGTERYRFYLIEGQSTRVDSVDVIITSVLGVNKNENKEISVYPNPVNSLLTINAAGYDTDLSIRITDVLGKVVYDEIQSPFAKIDVSNFKNGVYLVAITDKNKILQTKRIVVKH